MRHPRLIELAPEDCALAEVDQPRLARHCQSLIIREVGYFNGWKVSDETAAKDCQNAAKKVVRYLLKKFRKREDEQQAKIDRYRKAIDAIYNHNAASRAAVIQHFGLNHDFPPNGKDMLSAGDEPPTTQTTG